MTIRVAFALLSACAAAACVISEPVPPARPPAAVPAFVAVDPDEPRVTAHGTPVLQEGHPARVVSVAFSPDGSALASGAEDGTMKVWDTQTGAVRATLGGLKYEVRHVAWSADGLSLAAAGKVAHVWDTATGALRSTVASPTTYLLGDIAWAHDGRTLALYRVDQGLSLWDSGTGLRKAMLDPGQNRELAFATSPSADRVAGAGGKVVRLWSTRTGALEAELRGHGAFVMALAWSPDGTALVSGDMDGEVRIWDAATGQSRDTFEVGGHVWRVVYSPRGDAIAVAHAHGTEVYRTDVRGAPKRVLEGEGSYLAWNPAGTVLAASVDPGEVQIVEPALDDAPKPPCAPRVVARSDQPLPRFAWSPDGATLAVPMERGVGLWDATTGRRRLWLGEPPVLDAAVDELPVALSPRATLLLVLGPPSGRAVTMGETPKPPARPIQRTDGGQGPGVIVFPGSSRDVAFFSHDDALLVVLDREKISVVDTRTARVCATIARAPRGGPPGAGEPPPRRDEVSLSPDGRTLAVAAAGGRIELHDTRTGAVTAAWQAHDTTIDRVAYSPDGAVIASSGGSGQLLLWDADTHALRREPTTTNAYVLEWSADGRVVAGTEYLPNGRGGSDFSAYLVDVGSGVLAQRIPLLGATGIAISPDRRRLLAYDAESGPPATISDVATARPLATLLSESPRVVAAAFRPNGASVATASDRGTVDLWDTATFGRLARIDVPVGRPSLGWTPGGNVLAIAGPSLRLYRVTDRASLSVHALHGAAGVAIVVVDDQGRFDADAPALQAVRVRLGPLTGRDGMVAADASPLRQPGLLGRFLSGAAAPPRVAVPAAD